MAVGGHVFRRVTGVGSPELTPRERAVAEAAATGASTRDIAESLFLSPRTVESHLGAIYRKLGVTKRTELVALLAGPRSTPAPARQLADEQLPFPGTLIAAENFVGRHDERAALRVALEAAKERGPVTVMLGGPAGVGKTALVAHAALSAWTEGINVLSGRCTPAFGAPFQPVADALRPYLVRTDLLAVCAAVPSIGALGPILPDLAVRLPDALPVSDPAAARRLLVDTVIATLATLCEDAPALLVLEDLHWADLSTIALLRQLIVAPGPERLAIFGTFRDTELSRRHPLPGLLADLWREARASRLEVGGLSATDTEELAGALAGEAVPADVISRVHSRADGNPFFLLQLLRDRPGAEDTLPAGVTEVVLDQAARLGDDTVDALTMAAVIGDGFDVEVLHAALGADPDGHIANLGEVADRVSAAVAAGLVDTLPEAKDAYRFRHDLVRETLLGTLTADRLAEFHSCAAQAVVATYRDLTAHLTSLAAHYCAAGAHGDWRLAGEYAARAARQAIERHAPDEALALVEAGLAAIPQDVDSSADTLRFELLLMRTDAHATRMDLGGHHQAVLDAAAVARRLDSPAALAQAVMRNTVIPVMGTLDEDLLDLKHEAIAGLQAGDPLRVSLLVSASYQRTIGGHGWAAADQARQAVVEARILADPNALIAALSGLAAATLGRPDIGAQQAIAEELTSLGTDRDDLPFEYDGRRYRGILRLAAGDREGFEADGAGMDALAQRTGAVFLRTLAAEWRALLATAEADLPRAEKLAYEVLADAGDDPNFLLGWLVQMAVIRAEQDRTADILPVVQGARDEHPNLAALRGLTSWLLASAGDREAARELAAPLLTDDFRAVPSDWLRPATYSWLVPAAVFAGNDTSRALAEQLEPYAGRLLIAGAGTLVTGSADRFRGALLAAAGAPTSETTPLFDAGIALERRIGAHTLVAHAMLDHATALLASDDPNDHTAAKDLIGQAAAIASTHKLEWVNQRVRHLCLTQPR
ncbi:MAG: AAA family ATPase [Acidimicrobiales bacterium]